MQGFYEPIAGRRLPFLSIFISFGILFSLPLYMYGQTNVSGNVSGTWTTAGSPYILTGSATVPVGLT